MNTTILNFKIPERIKQKIQIIAKSYGLNTSEYIRSIIYRQLESEEQITHTEKRFLAGKLAEAELN